MARNGWNCDWRWDCSCAVAADSGAGAGRKDTQGRGGTQARPPNANCSKRGTKLAKAKDGHSRGRRNWRKRKRNWRSCRRTQGTRCFRSSQAEKAPGIAGTRARGLKRVRRRSRSRRLAQGRRPMGKLCAVAEGRKTRRCACALGERRRASPRAQRREQVSNADGGSY